MKKKSKCVERKRPSFHDFVEMLNDPNRSGGHDVEDAKDVVYIENKSK